jgi:NitT/TauT family transport system ATP-binding protein
MPTKIHITNVSKKFHGNGNGSAAVTALENVNLTVDEGTFVSILGPSGCGKSTLLYAIAGFETVSAGEVLIDQKKITAPGADRGMMFQDYALFPWRTLVENVMFGLEVKGLSKSERLDIARRHISRMGLAGFENRYPSELSGGMKQRAALARCVANDPDVLLMDEPLAAIDALTRNVLQDQILEACGAYEGRPSKTVLYVTHSIEEALYLSDQIVVMCPRPGRVIEQIKVPFDRPRSDATRLHPDFRRLMGEIWDLLKATMHSNGGANDLHANA